MGSVYPEIDERLARFIRKQHVYFVATAPRGDDGLLNLSPKGLDTFALLDPHTAAYLDFTGSGVETIANLRENGRVVVMFCAFEGPPRILRLHGRGDVVEPGDPEWEALRAQFPASGGGDRAVVRIRLERISDSCGYGVPLYSFEGQRAQLPAWVEKKGARGIADYKREYNEKSLNGLPGLRRLTGAAGD